MENIATITQRPCLHLLVTGQVQGVGFRPFVYRLAMQLGLSGYVRNNREGAEVLLQADEDRVRHFCHCLQQQLPAPGRIQSVHITRCWMPALGGFTLDYSEEQGRGALPMADLALCETCRDDLQNPRSPFYQYPFVSCTACGPRFSIVNHLPWDRARTSMAAFPLCKDCDAIYQDEKDRRFHAQTLACPACGPRIWLADPSGQAIHGERQQLLLRAQNWLTAGKIVAVKGVGGFHLCCDAHNSDAVARLRERKRRPHKPLALMFHSLPAVLQAFTLTAAQQKLLTAPSAPIVLVDKGRAARTYADNIAPMQSKLGVMLAYSPLHQLLAQPFSHGLVITSGNISGDPLCIDNEEATKRLGSMVDGFVLHDRAIAHPLDDSVATVVADTPMILRRARGYVPQALSLPPCLTRRQSVLALGGDLKNVVGQSIEGRIVLSTYHGNLAHPDALQFAQNDIQDLRLMLQQKAELIAIDSHPNYQSHRLGQMLAQKWNIPLAQVQHHHAHMAACLAENHWQGQQALGIVLDGLGYGEDGTLWGGEFLLGNYQRVTRLGRLTPSPLLGNDSANLEPWRCLLARLAQADGLTLDTALWERLGIDQQKADFLLAHQAQFVQSSSTGRLFDAVACLLGIVPLRQSFEGQAAMAVEAMAATVRSASPRYPMAVIKRHSLWELDPAPLWSSLLNDWRERAVAQIAADFQMSLVAGLTRLCSQLRSETHFDTVALTGGVMQNAFLLQTLQRALQILGFEVLIHQHVPANDGGLALGQAAVALARLESGSCV